MSKHNSVIEYELHQNYILFLIGKAPNSIAIICKKYYDTVLLKEIGILDAGNEMHKKIKKNQEENSECSTRLKLSIGSKDKSLPIMYQIPKLHKNPVESRFIIASKNFSTKPLSKTLSNVFKLIYSKK